MFAVLLNVATVIVGGIIGTAMHKAFSDRFRSISFSAIALAVFGMGVVMTYQGITGMTETDMGDFALIIFPVTLVIGGITGEACKLNKRLEGLGSSIQHVTSRFIKNKDSKNGGAIRFIDGFMSASILFCVGTMAIIGPIQAGLGDNSILYMKSLLDGMTAVILSSTLGLGVTFASIPVFIIEGGLALFAGLLKPYLGAGVITSINAVGGVMLVAIAFNMLEYKEIRVVNLLPAILYVAILGGIFG